MTTREIINSCEPTKDINDNLLYTLKQPDLIKRVYLSPRGVQLHREGTRLAEFGDYQLERTAYPTFSLHNSSPTEEILELRLGYMKVGVRRIPSSDTLDGLEQFRALRVLEERGGIRVASPFLATEEILVTEWVEGIPIDIMDPELAHYISTVSEIIQKLNADDFWSMNWSIRPYSPDYLLTHPNELDIERRITAVDPLCGFKIKIPSHRSSFSGNRDNDLMQDDYE